MNVLEDRRIELPTAFRNGGLLVFLNETAQTVRPRVLSGADGLRFSLLNVSDSIPGSATASELRQLILHQHLNLDVQSGPGLDVYFVTASSDPGSLIHFVRLLNQVGEQTSIQDIPIRAHGFALAPPRESGRWRSAFLELRGSKRLSGGGIYLLSTVFNGTTLDPLRSYPVLARLMRVFALTAKSRFQGGKSFTELHRGNNSGFYLAGLESYVCPPFAASAKYLLDQALFQHLHPVFSRDLKEGIEANANDYRPDRIEHWLLSAARKSQDLPELSDRLHEMSTSGTNRLLAGLAVDVTRALTYGTHLQRPEAARSHCLDKAFPLWADAELATATDAFALASIRAFPLPLHPFFQARHPSALQAQIMQSHADGCKDIASQIRRHFYRWVVSSHRNWLPPNVGAKTASTILTRALGLQPRDDLKTFASCHVDPSVSQDARDELCEGPETIDFLHLLSIAGGPECRDSPSSL